jgi:hypothetical protein
MSQFHKSAHIWHHEIGRSKGARRERSFDIVVVVEQTGGGSNEPVPLNEIPGYGIVARGPFRDGGNPG